MGSHTGHAPYTGGPQESIMGLIGSQAPGGGGLGKVQHSPIKPAIHMEAKVGEHASMVTPGEMESIAGLIGKSKAAQVHHNSGPMQAPP